MTDIKPNYACIVLPPDNQIALVIRAMAEGFSVKQIRQQGLLGATDNPFLWGQLDPRIGREIEMAQRAAGQLKADGIIDVMNEEHDAPTMKAKIEGHKWLAEKYTPNRFGKNPVPQQDDAIDVTKMTRAELQTKKAEVLERLRQAMEAELNATDTKEHDGGKRDRQRTDRSRETSSSS